MATCKFRQSNFAKFINVVNRCKLFNSRPDSDFGLLIYRVDPTKEASESSAKCFIPQTIVLNEFELLTYVTAVERVINNRPITAVSFSPDDWAAVTPSAVLIGSLVITDKSPKKLLKADTYTVKAYRKRPNYSPKGFGIIDQDSIFRFFKKSMNGFGTVPTLRWAIWSY